MASGHSAPAGTEQRVALLALRLTLGALFLWVFFENLGKGAYTPAGYAGVIESYLRRGDAPGWWKDVMRLVAANAAVAAPLQAAAELSFGALLTLGALTRPAGLAAGLFLFSLWISELGAAWIWELLVPTVVAFCLAVARAGRSWGVDALLSRWRPRAWWW